MTTVDALHGELILHRTMDDAVRVEVLSQSETLWLDRRRLAQLFGVDVRTVSEHLRNVCDVGELNEEATLRKIRMVRTEGTRRVAHDTVLDNRDDIFHVPQDREFESDFEADVNRIEAKRPQAEGAAVTNTSRHSEAVFETALEAHLVQNASLLCGGLAR